MSQIDDPMKAVADALNGHQVTDDEGKIMSETTDTEQSTTQETNTLEDTQTAEKSAETDSSASKTQDEVTENGEPELGVDDKGKRYVPESRFKEVYGKQKALERELAAERQKQSQGSYPPQQPAQPIQPQAPLQGVDKTTALELDLLKMTLQQFDPSSDDYDSELDKLGAYIYKANPGITMLEAGKRAIAQAKALTRKQTEIVAEARQVKALQSDQGITNRVKSSGQPQQADPEKMTLEEKEEWLKANGQW